jgi:hypothetical protein
MKQFIIYWYTRLFCPRVFAILEFSKNNTVFLQFVTDLVILAEKIEDEPDYPEFVNDFNKLLTVANTEVVRIDTKCNKPGAEMIEKFIANAGEVFGILSDKRAEILRAKK